MDLQQAAASLDSLGLPEHDPVLQHAESILRADREVLGGATAAAPQSAIATTTAASP